MRYGTSLSLIGLLATAGLLAAQQNGLGPPTAAPAPVPPTVQAAPALGPPPAPVSPAAQVGPALGPPPATVGQAPVPPPYPMPPGPYPPMPPGPYAPMAPMPLVPRDPANPSIWGGVEALVWWTKNQPLTVPLITTGPASAGANAGNLGVPGTMSLNQPLNVGATGGVRFFAGMWFEPSHTWGMDGSVFLLGWQSTRFGAFDQSGTGSLIINEPVLGAPFSTQVSTPASTRAASRSVPTAASAAPTPTSSTTSTGRTAGP